MEERERATEREEAKERKGGELGTEMAKVVQW